MWLNKQMKRIWIDLAYCMRRRKSVRDFNVHEILMFEKTRKIRHFRNFITVLNDFRCTMSSMIDESRSCKAFAILSSHIIIEVIVESLRLSEINAKNYWRRIYEFVQKWIWIENDFHQRRFNNHVTIRIKFFRKSFHDWDNFVIFDWDFLKFLQHEID
jgi:hypothetical protein